jgi:hypothetical protein
LPRRIRCTASAVQTGIKIRQPISQNRRNEKSSAGFLFERESCDGRAAAMTVKQKRQLVEPDLRQTQSPRIQLGNKKRQKPVAPVPASLFYFRAKFIR